MVLRSMKFTIVLALVCSAILFAIGVKSDLSLGDETFHYRMAREIYLSDNRPTHDPLFGSYKNVRLPYVNAPLWHYGLAYFWKATGGPSVVTAQLYQVTFYFFLILVTYMIALELYGDREALYSSLIMASLPMATSLSIILHIDIPVALFTALCFLFLTKKRFFWAGVALGAMLLTKRNAYFLVLPYMLMALYLPEGSKAKKAKSLALFMVPALAINIPDVIFRLQTFSLKYFYKFPEIHVSPRYAAKDIALFFYDESNILMQPLNIVKYLGIVLVFSAIVYFVRKRYSKKDFPLILICAAYLLFFAFIFRNHLNIRYISPIVPLMAVIASIGLCSFSIRWLRYAILAILILQFTGSTYYVYVSRSIPQGTKEGYNYIRQSTLGEAHILSVNNSLSYYTDSHAMWKSYMSVMEMPYLFWKADEDEAIDILNKYEIDYIFVEKERVYDDSGRKHLGGYPESFIGKMDFFPRFKLIFENQSVGIWRIIENLDGGIQQNAR